MNINITAIALKKPEYTVCSVYSLAALRKKYILICACLPASVWVCFCLSHHGDGVTWVCSRNKINKTYPLVIRWVGAGQQPENFPPFGQAYTDRQGVCGCVLQRLTDNRILSLSAEPFVEAWMWIRNRHQPQQLIDLKDPAYGFSSLVSPITGPS